MSCELFLYPLEFLVGAFFNVYLGISSVVVSSVVIIVFFILNIYLIFENTLYRRGLSIVVRKNNC